VDEKKDWRVEAWRMRVERVRWVRVWGQADERRDIMLFVGDRSLGRVFWAQRKSFFNGYFLMCVVKSCQCCAGCSVPSSAILGFRRAMYQTYLAQAPPP
jgi:hypothetical protein